MIDPRSRGLLGSGIASVLRVGTLVAMAVVGIGYLLVGGFVGGFVYLVTRMPRGPRDPADDGARL